MQPRILRRIAIAVIAIAAGLSVAVGYWQWAGTPLSHVDVYDGFESGKLSTIWATDRFEPGAVTMQSEIVRAGHGAAKVVVHSRDMFEGGINGSRDSERAELREADKLISREDKTYQFSFSMFIPADFPIVPTRLVIAQWKQYCNGHTPCADDSPVVALRYVSGVLRITHQTGRHQVSLFETSGELRGRWTDFRFQIRFTPHEEGLLRAWVNGRQVVDYRGATAYPETAATGYVNPSLFYFKMGLYRDVMAEPMTIYIDEYRKTELPDAK
ncbi:MAG TPA: polysaccharide lyase [Candidatus Acidoferrales bacterium]|nr:polysaccharide lyase [Candidatus Acidoferrales bacterium]HTS63436.1 polysaccharide lyase [Candidatus Acidoferrales bacterium]